MAHALPTMQVPATVRAVLAARIDRLSPEEKHLLQTAAVMGMEVPLTLLQAVGELPEETLRLGFTHLQDTEFLYEASLFPEFVYTFKHALTQEGPTAACCTSGGGCSMPALSKPWRHSPETGWPSRWNGWPTMPCGARCGTRP